MRIIGSIVPQKAISNEDIAEMVDELKMQLEAVKDETISLNEIMEVNFKQNESQGMSTLREHLGKHIVSTGLWGNATENHKLEDGELLPGELSAVVFTLGCYTVRSATRVYKISGYSPKKEEPANDKDTAYVKETQDSFLSPWMNKFRITHEIMAKHISDPKGAFAGNFKYITRAASARNSSWSESIGFIGAIKKCASSSDEHASLFVLNRYMGDSFSAEYWYRLAPDGVITEYQIHPFDSKSLNASWKVKWR
jgi:hypothetical protein